MSSTISIVIPCLNERDNLPTLLTHLAHELGPNMSFEVILVDDGSTDDSLIVMKDLSRQYPFLRYISLSRNFGHQQALKAGLDRATGQCVITMDADLQHPPSLIHDLISKWREGFDVVYTVRQPCASISHFKRISAKAFYLLMNKLTDHPIDEGSADFRLLDRRVVQIIAEMQDPFLFLRGLVPWLGFRQYAIPYTPNRRFAGKTKYSLSKMLRLAIHGTTSFSIRPLRLATLFGSIISASAFLYGIYSIVAFFGFSMVVPGWASVVSSVLFLGGIQLLVLGIIGEYLGMLYLQAKHRPTYIIREQSPELTSQTKQP